MKTQRILAMAFLMLAASATLGQASRAANAEANRSWRSFWRQITVAVINKDREALRKMMSNNFSDVSGGLNRDEWLRLIVQEERNGSWRDSTLSQSVRSQAPLSKATNAKCAIKFHTLRRYKSDWWSRIFSDREVAPALRTLLKRDYGLFKESLKQPTQPEDSDSFMDKNGVLTLAGGVKGLYTIMEAKLIIEPCGNIYAVILDEAKRFLYFSNDRRYIDNLPTAIDEWRLEIESRRSQPSEVPKLPVVFRSK